MKQIGKVSKFSALGLIALLVSGNLLAGPITIRIDASFEGAPKVQVLNSEDYSIYVGPLVNNSAIEYGAMVNLLGVDNYYYVGSQIPELEWRFTDPNAPNQNRSAVFIVWIDPDYGDPFNGYYGPFYSGDLRIGFNQHKAGTGYYRSVNASPIVLDWVTLYSDATLVLQFKGFLPNRGQL